MVVNFSHFHLHQNHWTNFNQSWHKASFREDNLEIAKINWWNLKIFSRTTGTISTKFDTMHPWVKGIQVCSNEEPYPFPKGDNYEIPKFKNILLQNHIANKLKLAKSILRWWEFKFVFQKEGPCPFPRGDNNDKAKIHWRNLKIFSRTHVWGNFIKSWQKAFLGNEDSILF